ncbi:MAG: sortase family protein, partial [Thermoleophilia bacterium]|nr:sortase family protein [Thermoleophilia bacterium]
VSPMDRLTYPDIARIFGTGLIATGLGLLMFVVITITWGDPFTRLSEQAAQEKLTKQIAADLPTGAALQTATSLDPALTSAQASLARKTIPLGAAVGKIIIPKAKVNVNKVFEHGARDQDLADGPGLYKESYFPGSGHPIAIAGHRTTHGAPFLNIDRLRPGDPIILKVPYGTFTYRVTRTQIISPDDWSILEFGAAEKTPALRAAVLRTNHCLGGTCEHLVLTACHPKYSAAKRLAVFARLSKVQLVGGRAAAA